MFNVLESRNANTREAAMLKTLFVFAAVALIAPVLFAVLLPMTLIAV